MIFCLALLLQLVIRQNFTQETKSQIMRRCHLKVYESLQQMEGQSFILNWEVKKSNLGESLNEHAIISHLVFQTFSAEVEMIGQTVLSLDYPYFEMPPRKNQLYSREMHLKKIGKPFDQLLYFFYTYTVFCFSQIGFQISQC